MIKKKWKYGKYNGNEKGQWWQNQWNEKRRIILLYNYLFHWLFTKMIMIKKKWKNMGNKMDMEKDSGGRINGT